MKDPDLCCHCGDKDIETIAVPSRHRVVKGLRSGEERPGGRPVCSANHEHSRSVRRDKKMPECQFSIDHRSHDKADHIQIIKIKIKIMTIQGITLFRLLMPPRPPAIRRQGQMPGAKGHVVVPGLIHIHQTLSRIRILIKQPGVMGYIQSYLNLFISYACT